MLFVVVAFENQQSPQFPQSFQAILLLPLGGAVMHMRPEATAYCFRSMKVSGHWGHRPGVCEVVPKGYAY